MEILAYQVCGSWSNNISITYDSKNDDDRVEADKYISRIIPAEWPRNVSGPDADNAEAD